MAVGCTGKGREGGRINGVRLTRVSTSFRWVVQAVCRGGVHRVQENDGQRDMLRVSMSTHPKTQNVFRIQESLVERVAALIGSSERKDLVAQSIKQRGFVCACVQ